MRKDSGGAAWSRVDTMDARRVMSSMTGKMPLLTSLRVGAWELFFAFIVVLFSLLKDLKPLAEPVFDHRLIASGGG